MDLKISQNYYKKFASRKELHLTTREEEFNLGLFSFFK